MCLKDPHQESFSAIGVIPAHLKTLIERNYQVVEKEEDDLHEQEQDIFDNNEHNKITISGKGCQIVFYVF